MNPVFKNLVHIQQGSKQFYQCEIEGITAGWLLRTFGNSGDEPTMYLCEHIAYCIETARRRGTDTLDGDESHTWDDDYHNMVQNNGHISSAQVNYQLLVGARVPKKVLATARNIIRNYYSYQYDKETGRMSTNGVSFSIRMLVCDLRDSSCAYTRKWISNNFPEILPDYGFDTDSNINFRREILQRIQNINPDFVFTPITIGYQLW